MRPASRSAFLVVVAAALCASACRDTAAPPEPVAGLRLSTDSAVVYVDSAVRLTAEVLDAAGIALTGRGVTWRTSDTTIASVDSTGLLHGLVVGGTSLVVSSDTASVRVPVAVVVRYASVVAGTGFSCALSVDGWPYCWGSGGWNSVVPKRVPDAPRLSQLAVGYTRACGLTGAGEAYCWGADWLGNGDSTGSARAVRVSGGLSFVRVSVGLVGTCALTGAGAMYCWGYYPDQPDPAALTPAAVAPSLAFTALATGFYHMCGVTGAGEAYCWGRDFYGQLGSHARDHSCDGTDICNLTPTKVDSVPALVSIRAGSTHTCGLTATGEAYCWGGNGWGQLGDTVSGSGCFARQYGSPSVRCSETPVAVAGGLRFTSLNIGIPASSTCAATAAGEVYCWGANLFGEFGNGSAASSAQPTRGGGTLGFQSLSAGHEESMCGLSGAGTAYCWGRDLWGELGVALVPGGNVLLPTRVLFQP